MKTPSIQPRLVAPSSLSRPAKELWRKYMTDFGIEDQHGIHLINEAMAAYDRALSARAEIKKHGVLVSAANGKLKNNPALQIEHQSLLRMLACLKLLNIDVEPVGNQPGPRPGSGRKNAY